MASSFEAPQSAAAQTAIDATELPTRILVIPGVDQQGNASSVNTLLPDWTQISFSQMPPIRQSGSLSLPNLASSAGNNGSRIWIVGQTPDQYLTLGDISPVLQPELLSIDFIAQQTDLNLEQVALSAFTLVAKQTLNQLVQAVPLLEQFQIKDIPPIAALLTAKAAEIETANRTLAQVLHAYPQLGQLKLGEINLSSYSMAAIPNLGNAQLGSFSGWQTTLIQDIPGLNLLPFSSFPHPVTESGNLVMRIDAIYGAAERQRTNTISGSDVEGFSVNCRERDCAYIELDDLENSGRKARGTQEGKQWISGKYQEVEGGWGCLKGVNSGKEPTGRFPFGGTFKVVVMEPDERTDTVDTALFFRFCSPCGCSPYFIGPVPFFSYRVNSPIFVGLLSPLSAQDTAPVVSGSSSTPTGATRSSPPSPPTKDVGTAAGVNVPCLTDSTALALIGTVQGINVAALSEAIASLESSNSYNAVGVYVCADGGQNCGVPLGKYQLMSYNEYAATVIASKPGGNAFLSQLQTGKLPTPEELFQFFPPADQEVAFQQSIIHKLNTTSLEIDPTTGNFFTNERLIERVAQKYFGGDNSLVDGQATDILNRLTLKTYGQDILQRYQLRDKTSTNLKANFCASKQ